MYFGSVRFFKHLILSVLVLIIVTLATLTTVFAINCTKQKALVAEGREKNAILMDNAVLALPDGKDFDTVYDELKAAGLSAAEISALLKPPAETEVIPANGAPDEEGYPDSLPIPDGLPDYTTLYPDLYTTAPTAYRTPDKTIYLTFDDGPSDNTPVIMSILDKYDIKATFFMTGTKSDEQNAIMKKVSDAGHTIGMHSFTHDYKKVYESADSYLADLDALRQNIFDVTGASPSILRFPGGSINNYNRFLYKQLISETTRRGYVYYDWDVSGEDAKAGADWTSIYRNVLNGVEEMDGKSAIVLLHDAADKDRTVTVVEDLILELRDKGYTFDKLTNEIAPTTFAYIS